MLISTLNFTSSAYTNFFKKMYEYLRILNDFSLHKRQGNKSVVMCIARANSSLKYTQRTCSYLLSVSTFQSKCSSRVCGLLFQTEATVTLSTTLLARVEHEVKYHIKGYSRTCSFTI